MNAYRRRLRKPTFLQYCYIAIKTGILIIFYSIASFYTLWEIVEDERYSNLRSYLKVGTNSRHRKVILFGVNSIVVFWPSKYRKIDYALYVLLAMMWVQRVGP